MNKPVNLPAPKTVKPRRTNVLSEQVFLSNGTFFRKNFTLSQLNALGEEMFDLLSEGLFVLDSELHYVSVSQQFSDILRIKREEILGKFFSFNPLDFYPPYYHDILSEIVKQLQNFEKVDTLIAFDTRGGKSILGQIRIHPVRFDNCLVYIGSLSSVTYHHELRQDIKALLQYDPLTQLPNLNRFVDALQVAIQVSEKYQLPNRQLVVIRLNIDRLQAFNESIGIQATDTLLCQFVERIESLRPSNDCRINCFSRFGGDNFGILLEIDDIAAAYHYLDQLSQLFEMPFFIGDRPHIYIRTSVGVALYPRDSISAECLISQAEAALKQARLIGGDDIVWYEKAHRNQLFQDTHLSSAFNRALQDAQIVPFFQPKMLFASPDKPMFEALVRWQHPILGTLTPQDFLDDVIGGMSQRLFERIITLSIEQLIAWKRLGYLCVVCINLDARQLSNERFLQFIHQMLDRYPCFTQHIELELTEIARLIDKQKAIVELQKLSDAGLKIALDDFGTGYASLSYLVDYPIKLVKIDKFFIQDMLTTPKKQTMVKSIVALAHSLDITVIAEGVETEAECKFLRAVGCDGLQGYYYSKPMSASQANEWLLQHFMADDTLAADFNRRYPPAVFNPTLS